MRSHAFLVGLGILLSRFSGLIRERIFAFYFGNSDAADAFKAALKIPNFLQNLFGEGVLSASFIPVYAEMIGKKHDLEAKKVASVIGSLLFILTSALVILGVLFTPVLIHLIAPGFSDAKKDLTIGIVQILFPGTGFLVMSAWCLGILNSHKRFFLSYVAPVIWNLSIILAMVLVGKDQSLSVLAETTAYGLLVGSFLQFAVQLPLALKLAGKLRFDLQVRTQQVLTVLKNFVPVVFSRGVVQVSSYVDNIIASLLPTGAVSALSYAQTLYLLPISLFGMSVSASELPTMSQAQGSREEVSKFLVQRLNGGLRRLAFFVVPSMIAFIFLGDLIVQIIFKTGAFGDRDVQYVWMVLVGYSLGLLMATQARLYSSSFYALKDTRSPLKFAIIRVLVSATAGYFAATHLPEYLGYGDEYGTLGLTVAASLATSLEFLLLKFKSQKIIGKSGVGFRYHSKIWFAALISAGVVIVVRQYNVLELKFIPQVLMALVHLGIFGVLYLVTTYMLKVDDSVSLSRKVLKKIGR